jgi:hypothetical protein
MVITCLKIVLTIIGIYFLVRFYINGMAHCYGCNNSDKRINLAVIQLSISSLIMFVLIFIL